MEPHDLTEATLNYVIHIADNQTRMAEAMATIAQQTIRQTEALATISAILERVVQTTDRTEQMTLRILAATTPKTGSH
jgi:hypothetical protein